MEGGKRKILPHQEHIWHTAAPAALWMRSLLAQVGRELPIDAEAAARGDLVIYLCGYKQNFVEPHVQPGSRCRVKADVYSLWQHTKTESPQYL